MFIWARHGLASWDLYSVMQATACIWDTVNLVVEVDSSPPDSSVHGILRQEYWSGLPLPSPEDLLDPGMEPASAALAAGFFTTEPPGSFC